MALTAKQERFVLEYLKDGNATRAAKAAGYSEKTAYSQGQRALKHVEVASALAKAAARRTERTEITMDYVISRFVIEAEREGEGSSHSARIAALTQLRQHLTGAPDPDDAPALNININTNAPVKDIRVTRHNA
jgi:phage terminase small subunit